MHIINTVFCPTPIHASKKRPKKKKMVQKHEFQSQKGEKINTTCLNGKSKSHNI